jgi:ribosome-binding factor A
MAAKKTKTRFAMPELGPSVSRRPTRVGDAIRKEIAMLLVQKIKDPRLAQVCITAVDMSPDLKNATVLYSCPSEDEKEVEAGLASAAGFIRSYLAQIMSMRYMPKLRFAPDLAGKKQEEMERLFREIEDERKKTSE